MKLNGRELRKLADAHDSQTVVSTLEQCLELGRKGQPGGVKADEFSVRDLFEALVPDGREAIRYLDPRHQSLQTTESVNSTLFSAITGQIIYSKILEAYESEDFVFSRLIDDVPTNFLDGEKIPGMTRIGDDAQIVAEGAQFPRSEFGQEYIETPATVKRGNIVSVTKEAVWSDRTGLILRRAGEVGEWLGANKEKRLVDVAIGAVNNYKRNGVAVNTYQTSTPWINDHANVLVDWTDIENSELLMSDIVDPNTGEPISLTGTDIVVGPYKFRTAMRIAGASEVRHIANNIETAGSNPVGGAFMPIRSSYLTSRVVSQLSQTASNAKEWWLHGNFKKAFAYMQAYPITTVQAPQNSYLEFERDIVSEYKTSERGVAVVMDPRYIIRNKHA